MPSHPQQRHTQTSGIAPLTSNKYQHRGQNSATGRHSPTLSVMVTAQERSATERASPLAFSRSQFPAHSRGNPPQQRSVTVTATVRPHYNWTQRDSPLRNVVGWTVNVNHRHTAHLSLYASDNTADHSDVSVPLTLICWSSLRFKHSSHHRFRLGGVNFDIID